VKAGSRYDWRVPTIQVQLEHASYPIFIERGDLARLGEIARLHVPHDRAVLCIDDRIASTHGETARLALTNEGYGVVAIRLHADEAEKTLETVRRAYDAMLDARIERGTPVLAVGGGIIGDVAGFVAATFLRGLPFAQVPTTLLAMVDASIGGKTGVNIEIPDPMSHGGSQKAVLGKNLVGAFWQPRFVLADPEALATLDERDYRCGLAECVKHGMIESRTSASSVEPDHLTFIASHVDEIAGRDEAVLTHLIEQSARIKAGIVEQDERESGVRALLNLGHTFAHAIESRPELDVRHGEAVAIGLCAATFAAEASGRLDAEQGESLRDLIALLDLPTTLPPVVEVDRLMEAMQFDKKVRGGRVRLILPTGIGTAEIADDVAERVVRTAWEACFADGC